MEIIVSNIKKGNIEEAIRLLLDISRGTPFEKELLIFSSENNINQRERRMGVIDADQYNLTKNKLTSRILDLIDDIKKDESLSEASGSASDKASLNILFCEANPFPERNLLSNVELRELNNILSGAEEQVSLHANLGLSLPGFIKAIKKTQPNIVHFISYSDQEGLFFHDEADRPEHVANDLFERFLSIVIEDIECLFVNTLISEELAQQISTRNKVLVIGFNDLISHYGAIEFATGFYKTLRNGNSFLNAYEIGCEILRNGRHKEILNLLFAYSDGVKVDHNQGFIHLETR